MRSSSARDSCQNTILTLTQITIFLSSAPYWNTRIPGPQFVSPSSNSCLSVRRRYAGLRLQKEQQTALTHGYDPLLRMGDESVRTVLHRRKVGNRKWSSTALSALAAARREALPWRHWTLHSNCNLHDAAAVNVRWCYECVICAQFHTNCGWWRILCNGNVPVWLSCFHTELRTLVMLTKIWHVQTTDSRES